MCNCIEKIEAQLAKYHDVVSISLNEVTSNEVTSVGRTFTTYNYTVGKKKKTARIIHSHCPFCGEKNDR